MGKETITVVGEITANNIKIRLTLTVKNFQESLRTKVHTKVNNLPMICALRTIINLIFDNGRGCVTGIQIKYVVYIPLRKCKLYYLQK